MNKILLLLALSLSFFEALSQDTLAEYNWDIRSSARSLEHISSETVVIIEQTLDRRILTAGRIQLHAGLGVTFVPSHSIFIPINCSIRYPIIWNKIKLHGNFATPVFSHFYRIYDNSPPHLSYRKLILDHSIGVELNVKNFLIEIGYGGSFYKTVEYSDSIDKGISGNKYSPGVKLGIGWKF